jgi:hypothetical protein
MDDDLQLRPPLYDLLGASHFLASGLRLLWYRAAQGGDTTAGVVPSCTWQCCADHVDVSVEDLDLAFNPDVARVAKIQYARFCFKM